MPICSFLLIWGILKKLVIWLPKGLSVHVTSERKSSSGTANVVREMWSSWFWGCLLQFGYCWGLNRCGRCLAEQGNAPRAPPTTPKFWKCQKISERGRTCQNEPMSGLFWKALAGRNRAKSLWIWEEIWKYSLFLGCKCLPLNYCNFGQRRSARVSLCEAESLSPLVII